MSLAAVPVEPVILTAALLLPLLGAAWTALWPGSTAIVLVLAPAGALLAAAGAAPGAELPTSWLMLDARVGIDALAPPMLALTGLVWAGAGLALPGYAGRDAAARLAPAWLLALAGNVGLVLALDVVTFFMFFTLMSFASYALVVARGGAAALLAARRYMVFVIAGEVMLFNALVLQGSDYETVRIVLLLAGFGVKAALLGLHVWLPLAHTAAPAPASAVLSGSMVAAGALGWLRFVDPSALPVAGVALATAGLAGTFYATVLGLLQRHPKAVLAYSSVAQLGLVAVAAGAHLGGQPAAAALAILYLLHHGLAKAALFVGVALAERLQGPAWRATLIGSIVAAAAIIGLPATSGAGLKLALKDVAAAALPAELAAAAPGLLAAAAVGSTLLMARFLALLPRPAQPSGAVGSVAAGFVLLVGSSVVMAVVLPTPGWAQSVGLLAPAAVGAALAVAGWALVRLRVVPVLESAPAGPAAGADLPVGLLALSIDPALRFRPLSPERFAPLREAAARVGARFLERAREAEAPFRRWALPGIAFAVIALLLVIDLGPGLDRP